ncbi:MAG: sodium:solute symporter [Odoribacteraceae bacterium]|jgi:Na+/proline symporter|nr:sodium:solute symporter [Odoribacteraceae bacterium]
MSSVVLLCIVLAYFALLVAIGAITSRRANGETFFTANRNSPWFLVAFAMVGTSLSGVTFISLPGEVGTTGWSYLTLVAGNCIGYALIAWVLLPLFYRRGLVSIYAWLGSRFGESARLSGSLFFILSQLIGASFRLFLVVGVLQLAIFDAIGLPFSATVCLTIAFVWLYTFRGGIKTIVWTDTLQTLFMLTSVVVTIVVIARSIDLDLPDALARAAERGVTRVFDFDWRSGQNTIKQLVAGIAITVAINGLDQNMMQKNLTCRTLRACRINMFSFSGMFFLTNVLFLTLGALLYLFADEKGIALPERTDDLFPLLSLHHFGATAGLFFILGVIAAAYSSVDSSLTALTTAFCIDFLKIDPKDQRQRGRRVRVHVAFSALMILVVILFRELNNGSVISAVFKAVGYTYGPLLGLFAFGLTTRHDVKGRWVPWVCLASPVLSFLLNLYSEELLWGYRFGFEVLLLNGALCYTGLLLTGTPGKKKEGLSRKNKETSPENIHT